MRLECSYKHFVFLPGGIWKTDKLKYLLALACTKYLIIQDTKPSLSGKSTFSDNIKKDFLLWGLRQRSSLSVLLVPHVLLQAILDHPLTGGLIDIRSLIDTRLGSGSETPVQPHSSVFTPLLFHKPAC